MKVVINRCYGGFGLSMKAVKRLAQLQGRKCHFFKYDFKPSESTEKYKRITLKDKHFSWVAFDISNPNEVLKYPADWHDMTDKQKREANELHRKHSIETRPDDRADPLLIKVVEELGKDANGNCAKLEIIEIPDGIEWEISEYDGIEKVEEAHRSWS